MPSDNLDVLGDCVVALNGCNYSLSNCLKSLDNVLQPSESGDEFQRLSKILAMKKVYKIYPITYINEQISEYNNIKNNRILSSIESLEKLNEVKSKEKEALMSQVELLQNRLEQFVTYKKRESVIVESRLSKSQAEELEKLQEEIDSHRFQVSKLQLQKARPGGR